MFKNMTLTGMQVEGGGSGSGEGDNNEQTETYRKTTDRCLLLSGLWQNILPFWTNANQTGMDVDL